MVTSSLVTLKLFNEMLQNKEKVSCLGKENPISVSIQIILSNFC